MEMIEITDVQKEEISENIKNLNKEANENWDNEKILQVQFREDYITVAIGKFDEYFFDVIINEDGWKILRKSGINKNAESILETIMHSVIIPIILGE